MGRLRAPMKERLSDDEYREALHARRIEKVVEWLDWLDDVSTRLEGIALSRRSELASEAGADPDPKLRPCEHRTEWFRGRLCLACDNTGMRPATKQERADGLAYDPYLVNPPRSTYAVVRDTSAAALRTARMERMDALIGSLQRDARLRAGAEVAEDPMMRLVREVQLTRHDHPALRRIESALAMLKRNRPDLYRGVLARDPHALRVLALLLPGRMPSTRRANRGRVTTR